MVIALDAATTAGSGTGLTSGLGSVVLTWNHTVAGTARYLVVGVSQYWSTEVTATYNGVAMTQIGRVQRNNVVVQMFGLYSPDVGTHAVTLTRSVGTGGSPIAAAATSWTGVGEADPIGTVATNDGSSSGPGVIASAAAGQVVVDMLGHNNAPVRTATVGAGQTLRGNVGTAYNSPTNNAWNVRAAMSSEPGAASVGMDWTLSGSADWGMIAVPLKPGDELPDVAPPRATSILKIGSSHIGPLRVGKEFAP